MSSNRRYMEASCSYPPPPLTASYVYVKNKANEFLESPDVTAMTNLVAKLLYRKETEDSESPSSKLLYESFVEHFPILLVEKLIQVYSFVFVTPKVRSYSLMLLETLLIYLDHSCIDIETECLEDIETHLYVCISDHEVSDQDLELVSRILSHVSYYINVEYFSWSMVSSCIISQDMHPKALLFFSEWSFVIEEEFLIPLLENDLDVKIIKRLLNPDSDEEWSSALQAGFILILQLVNNERDHLISDLFYAIVKSVWEMVNVRGKEIVVRQGFVRIAKKVRQEVVNFLKAEYKVVSGLALMLKEINGIGEGTEKVAKTIHEVLDKYYGKC